MKDKEAKVFYERRGSRKVIRLVLCKNCEFGCFWIDAEENWHGESVYHHFQCMLCKNVYVVEVPLINVSE